MLAAVSVIVVVEQLSGLLAVKLRLRGASMLPGTVVELNAVQPLGVVATTE